MNVIKFQRPETFTTPERMLKHVRDQMFKSGRTNKEIADSCGVGISTINNLMTGKTRWPRPATLFPLLEALGLEIKLELNKIGAKG
jgi:transcriptional regulator with XRE-family HTH domain